MTNLTRAFQQLYSRQNDERFETIEALRSHCEAERAQCEVKWRLPSCLFPVEHAGEIKLKVHGDLALRFNDWSFSQVCKLAGVRKETINRLTVETATKVLYETLPRGGMKPFQLMTDGDYLRAIHGVSYTRLFNEDVLNAALSEADGFAPPPKGRNGGTGLYAGEQDMFVFLIDDDSWVDIDGEDFAPGFFVWNSEVGARSVGIETFWFQRLCANHIVWDAREVTTYSRKHTANVGSAIDEIRLIVRYLASVRDQRKDAFVQSLRKAKSVKLGNDSEEVRKSLATAGISMSFVKKAVESMEGIQSFTVFDAVNALTRLTGQYSNAGERVEQDFKIGQLLSLAI